MGEVVDTFTYFLVGTIFVLMFVFSTPGIPIIGPLLSTISYYFKTLAGIIILSVFISFLSLVMPQITDYVKEVIAALLVAYSTFGVLVAFEIAPGTVGSIVGNSMVAYAISAFVVLFVFGFFAGIYRSSGGDIGQLLMAALIVSVLVYMSLGPWSPVVRRYVKVARGPIKSVAEMVSAQAEEMNLLIFHPFDWYKRQQMKNAAADNVNPPVGVEILGIDNRLGTTLIYGHAAPFDIHIKNKGEHTAGNVVVGYKCKGCASSGDKKTVGKLEPDEEDVETLNIVPEPKIIKGATQANIEVTYYTTYTYSTDTNLEVKIMGRQDANEVGYHQVLSYTDNAPAIVSLNVGRQPQIAGKKYSLMISFIKQKLSGEVDLRPSSTVVYVPKRLSTTKPSCSGTVSASVDSQEIDGEDYWIIRLKSSHVLTKTQIDYEICDLTAPMPENTRAISGVITAKFRNYRYTATSQATYPVDLIGNQIIKS